MMYLGTDSGGGEVAPNGEGGRYYLAPDEARARQYGENVIEVYANAAEGIQADGTVIVQGAEHIKAVENQGTFDAGNPAIRYSLVEEGRMEAEGKDVFHERQGSTRPRGVTIEEIGEAIRTRKQMGELVLEAQKLGYRSEAGRLAREIMNGSAEQSAANIGLLAKAYARESGDEKYVGLAREREEKEGASEGRNLEELGARLQAAGKASELIGEAIKQGQRRQSGRMAQGMMNGSVEQSAANLGLLAKIYAQESDTQYYLRYNGIDGILNHSAIQNLNKADDSELWEEQIEAVRNYIQSDAVNKEIHLGRQGKHLKEAKEYIVGRSYLYGDINAARNLVQKYCGTGEIIIERRSREWAHKEVVEVDYDIGVNVDPITGNEVPTNRFTIHYGQHGSHVVPTRRKKQ